jgi:Mg2+/Co2+ transporter CorB
VSSEHLRTAASTVIPYSQQRMLGTLLDLESATVEDIMIPRSDISSIDLGDDWDTILDVLRTTPHTRLPVCIDNLDNIVGILHMKKVAHALAHGELTRDSLAELAREREAYFVPEGTTLSMQLHNFQRDRRRIALVVDEYGDIRGLVTLEDILEEIVGEFTSDPGTLHKDIHRDTDGSYVVSGAINVRVLNRTLGWTLPTDGPRTLNGLILEMLETIPEPGTGLRINDIGVEILQVADNAVKTARMRPIEAGLAKGAA